MTSLLLVLALAGQVPGSIPIDPALRWYTIETPSFSVHFSSPDRGQPDSSSEQLARRVAFLCEEAHALLVPVAGWTPRGPTDVVIADFFDYANGWAAPLPRNTITIIPTLPAGSRTGFDDWLRTLIIHEYAHTLQLDMVRGVPGFLRRVFGRVIITNPLMPFWLIEGWALKAETDHTGYGRLRGTEYDMMLRAAADSGRLLPVDRAGHYSLEQFPAGNAPYLYGGPFYRWVESAHGDTAWPRYHRRRSGGVPFFEEPHARRLFGRGFPGLWRDWLTDVRRHADTVGRRIEADGLTPLLPATDEGFATGSACWSRSGRELYYYSRDGTEYPAIKSVETATGVRRVLHRGPVTGGMSLSPDGRRLVFARRDIWRSYYEFSDLWTLDPADGSVERLTHGLRATDPDWSPDGRRVLFVLNHGATSDLCLLDLRDRTVENLTRTADPTGYSRPRFSPDGRYIAVSVNRPDGQSDIEVLDTRTGWTIPVTNDRAVDLAPEWSPTGQWLYYASDRSGVFNIHAWSPDRDAGYRCTNTRWGLFEPAVSPDNRYLAVTAFGPRGNDIALVRLDPEAWLPDGGYADTLPPPVAPGPGLSDATLYYYRPTTSLAPALWFPLPVPTADGWFLGGMTFGWDALQLHRYALAAGWQTGDRPGPRLQGEYRYSGVRPELALETDLALDRQELGLLARLPFRRTRSVTVVSLGSRLTAEHPETGSLARLRWLAGFGRSTALRYRFGVAPVEGGTANVSAAFEHRSALGARNRLSVFHDFRHWYRLPAHASLRARVAFGVSLGDASADSTWQLQPGPAALGVRGFTNSSDPAGRALLAGAECRLPLLHVERGLGTAPLFLSNLNAAAFAEAGMLWNGLLPDATELESSRLGAGLELCADLILGHMVPARLTIGAALGTRPGDWRRSHQLYAGIESSMIAGLLGRSRRDRDFFPVPAQ
ncbi:MAG: hypothetical protein R6X14_01035 [bacterium]